MVRLPSAICISGLCATEIFRSGGLLDAAEHIQVASVQTAQAGPRVAGQQALAGFERHVRTDHPSGDRDP